jgi:hypothetical protein
MKSTIGLLMNSWFCVTMVVAFAGCDSPKGVAATEPGPTTKAATKALAAHDTSTGTYFRVNDDGRVLTATDENGRVLWAVDVIEKAGAPFVGEPKIRHLSVVEGKVAVVYGKHSFANFEPKTGKLLSSGSN